jgi:hypothetical protein
LIARPAAILFVSSPSAADQPKPDIVKPATFVEYDGPDGKSIQQPGRQA